MLSEAFWTLPMCNALLSICHASSKRKDQLVDKHHLGRDKRNTACLADVNQMKPCNSQVGYWYQPQHHLNLQRAQGCVSTNPSILGQGWRMACLT